METFGANKEGDDYTFAKKIGVSGDSHRVALLNNGIHVHSYKFAPGFSTKKHMHGEGSDGVNMISEGTVKIVTDNGSETFEKGDVFTIPGDVEYTLEVVGEEPVSMFGTCYFYIRNTK